jgi:hypothetical protein
LAVTRYLQLQVATINDQVQNVDAEESTKPALGRIDWSKYRRKSVSWRPVHLVPYALTTYNTHIQVEENNMRIKTPNLHGLIWTLTIAALFAACQVSAEQTTPAVDDSEINWLFVVSATSGSFDGKTITLRDVPPVLIFSDRPDRVWGHMTVSELLPKVEGGADSFTENPPNSVLSTFRDGELPTEATVVMHRPTLDGANLSFEVDVLGGHIPATFGPASLFVDRVHGHAGAFIVGAAVANNHDETETVVVREPTYVYHADPAPAAAPASAQSRLAELKSLFDQGLISEDEYARKREEILASM